MKKLYLFFAVLLCSILGTQTAKANIVYCDNNQSWSAVYAYLWTTGSNGTHHAMTNVGDNLWALSYTSKSNVIFESTSNFGNQTADLTLSSNSQLFQANGTDKGAYSWKLTIGGSTTTMTFNSSTNKYTATVTLTGSGTLKIADNWGWYTFVGSSSLADNSSVTSEFSTTASSHTLSAGEHTITWDPLNKKISDSYTPPATTSLTGITLTDGSSEYSFTGSGTTWSLASTEVTVGNTFTILAEYTTEYTDGTTSTTETKTYTTSSTIASGSACSLSEGTTGFSLGFKQISATLTASDEGVPTSVTFTNEATETSRSLTSVKLHKSGGSDIAFTQNGDTWTLDDATVSVGSSSSYYITATYTVESSDNTSTTATVNYNIAAESSTEGATNAVASGTAYTLSERTDDYFYFDYTNTKTDAVLTVTDGAPATVTFTEVTTDTPTTDYPKVALVNNAGGSVVAYFTQDATKSWLWTLGPQSINTAGDNSNDEKYRFRVYTSSTEYVDYSVSAADANYWIDGDTKYDLVETTGNFCVRTLSSGYFAVSMKDGVLIQGVVSGSDASSLLSEPTDPVVVDKTTWKVTASSSEPAVFLVGDYFNNWRVTPEYQLTKNADGVYELKNFVIYPDTEFQIRVYTSETSYTSYGLTAGGTYWLQTWNVDGIEHTLSAGVQSLDWKLGQTMIASLTFDNSSKKLNIDIDESKPSTYSSAPIKGVPFVSLVGEKFTQAETLDVANGERYSSYHTTDSGWADGHVQYDANGNVIVYDSGVTEAAYGAGVAAGKALYNTIWPPRNPIAFSNNEEALFEFTSDDITFKYVGVKKRSEAGTSNEEANADTQEYAVYEIPYIWMDGRYKIWTGWGGQHTYDYDGSSSSLNPEWRSHYNWGCGGWSADNSEEIAPDTFYALNGKEGNSAGGNFNFDEKYYFSKVEFWYNISDPHGTTKSFFIGYLANGDPMVEIERTNKSEVTGTYSVYGAETSERNITSWMVELYKENGASDVLIKSINGEATTSSALSGTMVVDGLESGEYYYRMTVSYEASGDMDAETVVGESTHVRIFGVSMPANAVAEQVTELGSNGETLYSFDVKLTASAPETLTDVTVVDGDGNEVAVLSLVDYYVVGIPTRDSSSTDALYTGVTAKNSDDTDADITAMSQDELVNILTADDYAKYQFDTYTYYGVAPDAANNYALPTITFENVIPGDYTLYVSMGASDGDVIGWEDYNVTSASASISMVKPVVAYSATGLAIDSVEGNDLEEYDKPTLGQREEQPIQYTNTNMVSTTGGKLSQLAVTNDVLNNWKVTYTMTTTINGSEYVYSNADMQGVALNGVNGVDADFEYLPMSSEAGTSYSTGITTIDSYQSKIATGADIVVSQIAVGYKRAVTDYETTTPVYGYNTEAATLNLTAPEALAAYDDVSATYAMQWEDRWNGQTETADKYSNAFAVISFTPNTALNDVAGYYSSNSVAEDTESANNWMAVDPSGNVTKFPAAGGVVIDQTNSAYSSKYLELGVDNFEIGNVEKNYGEGVANAGKLPIKIWHVGDGSEKPTGTLYTLLTADYPIVVKPAFKAAISDLSISTAAVEDGVEFGVLNGSVSTSMTVLSYPTLLNADLNDMTTGIEDVVADGDVEIRIYPNPAVDVVTVAGAAALGTVEIYSLDGRLVKVVEAEDYSATIAVGDLAKGTYVVRAGGMTERMIKM